MSDDSPWRPLVAQDWRDFAARNRRTAQRMRELNRPLCAKDYEEAAVTGDEIADALRRRHPRVW